MKKEKRRNMRSAEAGAHDGFVILSIRRERLIERGIGLPGTRASHDDG